MINNIKLTRRLPNEPKPEVEFLTKKELLRAFDYINKRIEEVGGPPNFFTFGKVIVPDIKELEKKKRAYFLNETRKNLNLKNLKKYMREVEEALCSRIAIGIDLTIVLRYFTEEEKEIMRNKGYPVDWARSGGNMQIFQDFLNYLDSKVKKYCRNKDTFIDFIMRFYASFSTIDLLNLFPFDKVKKKELELIASVKTEETTGISFGTNTDFKNNFQVKSRSSEIILPEDHFNSLTTSSSNYIEDTTLFDLFNNLSSLCYMQRAERDYFVSISEDKEWANRYFDFKEKDYFYLEIAINSLDGYQETKILL